MMALALSVSDARSITANRMTIYFDNKERKLKSWIILIIVIVIWRSRDLTMSVAKQPVPTQDAAVDNFLMRLRTKNTRSDMHAKTVDAYAAFWQDDYTDLANNADNVASRKAHSADLTNHYYNLATGFVG